MAKKDFLNYYAHRQEEYMEMLDNVKELQNALGKKMISEERFEEAQKEINTVKSNFDTLSYVVMLLNIPLKKEKREKFNEDNRHIFDYLINVDDDEVRKQNRKAIENLKRMTKEIKEENGD